ncbi:MAG: Trk system potassium transporter TrkA [Planctomycetes bacterium]|nr:Trk system potassium transporter TrkA [Planctomycetota bacterium]
MYVVIVGGGEVGSYVARVLVEEGHDVAVIEADEDLARRLDASMNALVVPGSGVNPAVLQRAGLEQADLFLALTGSDEVNLIACMTGRKRGKEGLRTVARVRWAWQAPGDPALSADELGLEALISPRREIATETIHTLRYVGSGEVRELAGGKVVLVGMALGADSPLVHETLASVRRDFAKDFLIVAVQGHDGLRIPTGSDRLQADDRAFVMTLPGNVAELAILSGQPWSFVRRVLIVGCGNSGLAVARELEAQNLTPTIIEADRERAELVAGLLPRSLIIHGDGSDPDFLRGRIEEREIDAVVVLLKDAEMSVLIGIFAKSLGARKVIVRCDESGYVPLAHKLGVDAVLSPNRAMINAILRHVRRGKVEATLLLGDHEAEVLEFKIPEKPVNADLFEKPLKDIPFPPSVLVGAVVRGGEAIIASGTTVLQPGDELLVVCARESLGPVERLLC